MSGPSAGVSLDGLGVRCRSGAVRKRISPTCTRSGRHTYTKRISDNSHSSTASYRHRNISNSDDTPGGRFRFAVQTPEGGRNFRRRRCRLRRADTAPTLRDTSSDDRPLCAVMSGLSRDRASILISQVTVASDRRCHIGNDIRIRLPDIPASPRCLPRRSHSHWLAGHRTLRGRSHARTDSRHPRVATAGSSGQPAVSPPARAMRPPLSTSAPRRAPPPRGSAADGSRRRCPGWYRG